MELVDERAVLRICMNPDLRRNVIYRAEGSSIGNKKDSSCVRDYMDWLKVVTEIKSRFIGSPHCAITPKHCAITSQHCAITSQHCAVNESCKK